MARAKLERLMNLTALLLHSTRPVSADEVRSLIAGYPRQHASFRRAFERDKEELRAMGIPLVVEKVPFRLPAVDGYRIPKDRYYLRDPKLEPEELAALHLAASAVQVEGLAGAREGLAKLGGLLGAGAADPGLQVTALPSGPNLATLFGAVAERRPVEMTYHGVVRVVDPYRLEYQRGRWYLTGHDRLRGEDRNYRVDRIEGKVRETDLPSFDPPRRAVPGASLAPWELGEGEPVRAQLRIDAAQAPWALQHVGPANVVEDLPDGGVVVELPVTNRDAFRSFVLSFLDHAEVVRPPEVREEIVDWLERIAGEQR